MDVVQVFNDEIQSLLDTKPPLSKAKMGLITRAAMKGVKFYKHIVQIVEKFIIRSRPEFKVPGLYVIDSIVRQSRHQFGVERDVYATRFSRNLQITFNNLFLGCSPDDKPKIVRVLNLWQKNGVFNSQVIQPLLNMANPNSSLALATESTISADSPGNGNSESTKSGHNSKYLMHHVSKTNHSASNKHSRTSDVGSRCNKNMIDYEYNEDDDDDGDETPTEAEPPLSSTLNKIEMEQRSRNDTATPKLASSQLQQAHHLQQAGLPNQLSMMRNEQDPVLERWNKIFKQQSIPNDGALDECVDKKAYRARSRSPVHHDKYTALKQEQALVCSAESEAERMAERERKCLPKARDKHLTVCSSTLWLGHVPKTVSEADISDAFGEYGTITSIDLIPPRGCAYVCMDRRQDAKRALSESKDLKLNGSHIKMAWAPGKGFKEYKKLKEFWEVDTGSSYIPYNKLDSSIDFEILEEGGVIDEDSMSAEMRETRERKAKEKQQEKTDGAQPSGLSLPMPALPILTRPPPAFSSIPPPNLTSMSLPPAMSQASGIGSIPYGVPPPIVTSANSGLELQDGQKLKINGESYVQSPGSLDQQLSMTDIQISMVEQQLQQIQQAQGLNQPQPLTVPIFQPNPMLFDLQMMHGGPVMEPHRQQQMPMFANQPQHPLLPISQASINPHINGNSTHYGRY